MARRDYYSEDPRQRDARRAVRRQNREFISRTRATFAPAPNVARNVAGQALTPLFWGLRSRKVPTSASRGKWAQRAMSGDGRGKRPNAPGLGQWPFARPGERWPFRPDGRYVNAKGVRKYRTWRDFFDDETGYAGNIADWKTPQVVGEVYRAAARDPRFLASLVGHLLGLPANAGALYGAGNIGTGPCEGPCGPYDLVNGAGACALVCGDTYVLTPADQATQPRTAPGLAWWQYVSPGPTGSSIRARLRLYRPWGTTNATRRAQGAAATAPVVRRGVAPVWIPDALPATAPLPVPVPLRLLPAYERLGAGWPQGVDTGYGDQPLRPRPLLGIVGGRTPVVIAPPTSPTEEKPPDPETKERKFGNKAKGLAAVGALALHYGSEARDVAGALYNALPKAIRDREGCGSKDSACHAAALWNNAGDIRVPEAVAGVAYELTQDLGYGAVYGRAGRYAGAQGFGPQWEFFSSWPSSYANPRGNSPYYEDED